MDRTVFDNIEIWLSLSSQQQDKSIADLAKILGKDYVFQYTKCYTNNSSFRVPTFRHVSSNIDMNLIIGGSFEMGLSLQEEKSARQIEKELPFPTEKMRPEHQVQVSPFLISRLPLTNVFVQSHISLRDDIFRPEFGEENEILPVYLSREEIDILKSKFSFSLPSEAQWEYACRGGTKSLFYFGDSLPSEEILESKYLVYNFTDPDVCERAANPFGLIGLFVGDWCEDTYLDNYDQARPDGVPIDSGPPYVVRGGAAPLYPWQNAGEWQLCMSAMRNSSEAMEDETCSGRFVKLLDSVFEQ